MSSGRKTRFAAVAGFAALALLNACGGSDTADLAAANAENARLQEQLARAPAGGASSEELEKARMDLTEAQGQLTTATGERDAARMERDELLALFRGPAPSADPAARDEALMRTSAVIAETRAATDRAIRELAAAPAPAEKTTAALTQTSEALRLAGAALDAARSALTSSHHGNPLEDAYLEAAAARISLAEAQAAAEEGTADILRNADMALAQALAALAPLTSDRLRELREQLTATASGLATAMADLERTRMDLTGTRGTLSTATDDLSRTRGTLSTATDDLSQTRRTLSLTLEELAAADMPNSWTLPAGMAARFGSWHFDCAREEDGAEACGVTVAEPDEDGVHRLTYSGPLTFARAPTTNVRVIPPTPAGLTTEEAEAFNEAFELSFPASVFIHTPDYASGLASRNYVVRIPVWTTAMVGGADIRCSNPDCLVIVTPDNMVSSSGGRVTVTMPRVVDNAGTTLLATLDDERGRLERKLTLAAGITTHMGRIDVACPAGSDGDMPACSLIVDPTGTVSYWKPPADSTAGVPTIAQPRETVEVAEVPEGYMVKPMTMPFSVAAGAGTGDAAPGRYGIFDFTCPAGGAGCTVFVEGDGDVFASGGVTAVAPRAVVTEAHQRPGLAALLADGALSAEHITLAARGDEQKAGGLVSFSCPAGAGDDGCDILVSDNGVVTATGEATVSLTGTALLGRIAPTAVSVTVMTPVLTRMPTDVTISLALSTSAIERRTGASLGPTDQGMRNTAALAITTTANIYDDAADDILTQATGELPMRAVTVGDPPEPAVTDGDPPEPADPLGPNGNELKHTHVVHIYMPGARIVDTGAGGATDANPIEAGTVQKIQNATTAPLQATQDPRQYPTYVLSDADVVSSIELDGDRGVTVKLGGADNQGLAFADMKTGTEARPSGDAGKTGTALREWAERNHGDLTIKLAKDAYREDPHGDGAHYWEADVEFAVGGAADAPDGTYQLWLSNQAGSVSATSAKYLEYAAYGLFNFMDRTLPEATPICTTRRSGIDSERACREGEANPYAPVSARLQGLHFGFDTPTTGTDSIATLRVLNPNISATWSGRTTALAMLTTGAFAYIDAGDTLQLRGALNCSTGTCSSSGSVSGRVPTEELARLRGDVKLYACLGGAGSACSIPGAPGSGSTSSNDPADSTGSNRIEGAITNLEAFAVPVDGGNGVWRKTTGSDPFHATQFTLVSSTINADGAFGHGINASGTIAGGSVLPDNTTFGANLRGGDADHQRWRGSWGGRFYGPVSKAGAAFADGDGPAEVAGWWYIPGGERNNELHAIVGAFGATLDPPAPATPSQ